ncbi:MAG: hypothetical protein A3I05_06470 [Deltaproteobacteria bacterium RIFCSPLOWO2_02_FULL_44_10]|nr:MAG: hypothetical protein A3C46_06675 [Deltaproteobacteria bacterium RIFCSPHIGHO2_02_FULL_44_16]OGQ46682.1 MAG: hypothetical protein A3I05_06470 [Deltaproteobacteria bacterium RIFCSPLOWO2_02_FULL_44_10]
MSKERLDQLLVKLGFASNEKEASALLMTGDVLVDDVPVTSPGKYVLSHAVIRLRHEKIPYVSRGGIKLAHALNHFHIEVEGKIALDVGASTGGFTDCLLQHGAKKVYALDVGYGQLDMKLRRDERVVVFDRTHIRDLKKEQLREAIDLMVVDLSFTSTAALLKLMHRWANTKTLLLVLVKPQFEGAAETIEEGGIVLDPKAHEKAIQKVINAGEKVGWETVGMTPSPITGTHGNREFLVLFRSSVAVFSFK